MSPPPDASDLWAIAPFQYKTLPNNTCLVIRADTGAVSVMDARWQPFLGLFQRFRTLAQHSADLVARNTGLQPHERAIHSALARLCQDGLFVSGNALIERLTQTPAGAARRAPPRIAVTTCDRPQQLDRLLRSLLANERAHGNRWRYEIVDDSRRAGAIERNRALIAEHAGVLDLHYHGEAERRAFLERLLQQLPEAAPHLRWLLDSADPDHQGQATYGCPKNYLMLRYAGERLLLIDDDALMRAWRPSAGGNAVRFGHAGRSRRIAPDLAGLTADLVPAPTDPIAEHARLLGTGLADALSWIGAEVSTGALLERASLAQVARLDGAAPAIRATMGALIGDPGTWCDLTLLYQDRDVQRLIADDAGYRHLLARPRCAYTGEAEWVLAGHDYFQLATLAGLDLAAFLPPLMPSGRGEDTMIAVLLELLHPQDLTLVAPTALEHVPAAPRHWRPTPDGLADQLTPAAAFCSWARALPLGESRAEPRLKLACLTSHFQALAATDAGRRRLREQLGAATKRQWAQIYGEIARLYAGNRTGQGGWAADARASLAALQGMLAAPEVIDAQRLDRLVDQVRRYFAAFDAWAAARAVTVSGSREDAA